MENQKYSLSIDEAKKLTKNFLDQKRYKKCKNLCQKILQALPQDQEIQDCLQSCTIKLREKGQKHAKICGYIRTCGAFTLMAFMIFGYLTFKSINQKQDEFQASLTALIQENGDLQALNDKLYIQQEEIKDHMQSFLGNMQDVTDKVTRKRDQADMETNDNVQMLSVELQAQKESLNRILAESTKQLKASAPNINKQSNMKTVLILGTNGGLTDTILLGIINEDKQKVSLFSLPRDLYVSGRKINAVYKSFGMETLKAYIGDITALSVDETVVIDFQGFIQAIDMVGGLDINVPSRIEDHQYPKGDGSIETLVIEAGMQHFDGETALKYARTRKSDSDFERIKRQHQVIKALKDKMLANDQTDLNTLFSLLQKGFSNIKTDMNVFEAFAWYQLYKNYSLSTGNMISSQNFLTSSQNANGEYILVPRDSSFQAIQQYIQSFVE